MAEHNNILYNAKYDFIPSESVIDKTIEETLDFVKNHTRLTSFIVMANNGKEDEIEIYRCKESSDWECPNELMNEKIVALRVYADDYGVPCIQTVSIPWKCGYEEFKNKHRWTL